MFVAAAPGALVAGVIADRWSSSALFAVYGTVALVGAAVGVGLGLLGEP
jgi:hypothetical protein